MARLTSQNLVERAAKGAWMTLRDRSQPRINDPKSEDNGLHPPLTGVDGRPARLLLAGLDSPQAKQFDYETRAKFQSSVMLKAATGGNQQEVTADDIRTQEAVELDKLVALTLDWEGIEDDTDQPEPFSPDGVRALYAQAPDHREDALHFIGTRKNFFVQRSTPSGAGATTSSA